MQLGLGELHQPASLIYKIGENYDHCQRISRITLLQRTIILYTHKAKYILHTILTFKATAMHQHK